MKVLLFFIAFIGILCREVFTCNFADEKKDKCRTYINNMITNSTEAKYSEDKLKANFEALSEELEPLEYCFSSFFNSMKNAKEFFENIGKGANKSHLQKRLQQINTDFNTLMIENDLLYIWHWVEPLPHHYPDDITSEKLKGICDELAKIQTDLRNDAALSAVLKNIHNAEEKCTKLAAKVDIKKSDFSEFKAVFLDTFLTVKKAFYEMDLNAKIEIINETDMSVQETIDIGKVFQENYAAFKKLVNHCLFREDTQTKIYILYNLSLKTFEKAKELKMIPKLNELINKAKSFFNDMEKMEKNISEIIEIRRNIRKELNSIIGKQTPEYSTELGKAFYENEMEELLTVEDKNKFFNYFFLVKEMEKHLKDIREAFMLFA